MRVGSNTEVLVVDDDDEGIGERRYKVNSADTVLAFVSSFCANDDADDAAVDDESNDDMENSWITWCAREDMLCSPGFTSSAFNVLITATLSSPSPSSPGFEAPSIWRRDSSVSVERTMAR